jgi:hypothetical protein
MKEIRTAIEIHATADGVWRVLTEFTAYPEWNPLIHRVNADMKVGSRLNGYVQPAGGKEMSSCPKVLVLDGSRST